MSNRRHVDLDAARKARDEKGGEPPELTLGGKTFTLPPALPAAVVVGLARARRGDVTGLVDALESLFGDQLDDVLPLGLELDDLETILEGGYGEDPEASGSAT